MPATLPPERLRRSFDRPNLTFKTTAELSPGTNIIGQPRGVQAIDFGINMKSSGYNIYVLGESGTGRTTAIKQFVESKAAADPVTSWRGLPAQRFVTTAYKTIKDRDRARL
jgi:Cdc6-like AAA superfamily ATPase